MEDFNFINAKEWLGIKSRYAKNITTLVDSLLQDMSSKENLLWFDNWLHHYLKLLTDISRVVTMERNDEKAFLETFAYLNSLIKHCNIFLDNVLGSDMNPYNLNTNNQTAH